MAKAVDIMPDGTLVVKTRHYEDVKRVLVEHGTSGTLFYADESPTGHCKDCRHFEYDSIAKVGGIPLIVAHEICSRWGDGCKTSENGFCFMFEPREESEE